jgi:hypothetical protein
MVVKGLGLQVEERREGRRCQPTVGEGEGRTMKGRELKQIDAAG